LPDLIGAKVLVTGGAGFIGSHLVDSLLDRGVERVRVVDDLSLGSEQNLARALGDDRVTLLRGDCAELSSLATGNPLPYDFCFHMAVIPLPHSLVHPEHNVRANIAMTTAVCELGRSGGYKRLVHFSSSEVFGNAQELPMSEDHPLAGHTPYAASKAGADLVVSSYAKTFGLETVTVRPFNTYGSRQNAGTYAGLIPAVLGAVVSGAPVHIYGDGEQTRDMTYVADTVAGTLALAASERTTGRSFNLGTGSEASVNMIVGLLLSALGCRDHPILHVAPRPGDVRRLVADISRARDAVDFDPSTPLAIGIKQTVDWYLESGSIPEPQPVTW
jgi:UDP-glucose 4-epimerase